MIDPILEDIYSTVLPSAPYVIVAYALIWVVLLVYMLVIARGTKRAEKQMALLEEQVDDLKERGALEVKID